MMSLEKFAEIRRLFFAEHLGVETIASQVDQHPDAVRRAIGSSAFNQRKARSAPPTPLDPYKGFIVETLTKYPRLRATRLHQMAKERGYSGSVGQLRRFVATVRGMAPHEGFLRRNTLPGEESQTDWAHFGQLQVGHAQRALVLFVMVLGYSRGLYARFFHDQTMTSFLFGHVGAFAFFGGVPRRVLYDNLKSAVVERRGDHIRYNDDLLSLSAHYHFEPRPCAPYRGNEKGKVERAIRYIRDNFFAARAFQDLDDLNGQLAHWIAQVAHVRPAPGDAQGRSVRTLLDEERPRLLPLPPAPFPAAQTLQLASGKTPYLRIDRNDYSIPHTLVGRPLTVRLSPERVRIFDGVDVLVAEHTRTFGAGVVVENPAHIAALRGYKRHARELRGRDELTRQCPSADRLLGALAERNAPLQSEVHSLLLLCGRYGANSVDRAIADCLDQGLASARSVERRLDEDRRRKGLAPSVSIPSQARIALTPTDLATYDRIGKKKETGSDR